MSSSAQAKTGSAASRMGIVCLSFLAVALAALLAPARAAAADSPAAPASIENGGLPPYNFGYTNALYATIAGYLSIKEVDLKDQKTYKLEIKSFRKKMPVKAVLQRGEAPLVVILLGVDGRTDSPLGKLWFSWYVAAGYHVMTFDSTFLPSFVEVSGQGVTGNMKAEAAQVAQIIAAFLELSEVRGKVQKIGIVGMSYGGLQALFLGQMAQAGQLPFKIDSLLAFSPPIKLDHTGELLDRWYDEDRWNYTLAQLADKLSGHKPVAPGQPVPFTDSMMRAGIAALFRLGLSDVVLRNDKVYKLRLLPGGNEYNDEYIKEDYAKLWGYTRFIDRMCFPYWAKKTGIASISELTGPAHLENLLENQLPCAQVILAEDDPFDTPEDMAEFKAAAAKKNVILLPHGGHLGYVNEPWTKAKLQTLFGAPEHQASVK